MSVEGRMAGREIRSARVALWYDILPGDVRRMLTQPKILNEDVDRDVEKFGDRVIEAWKRNRAEACAVLASEFELLHIIGRSGRIRLLTILTSRSTPDPYNVFAALERERLLGLPADAGEKVVGEDGDASGDLLPPSSVFDLMRGDLASLQRVITARLIRGTSAKRTVAAIVRGIDDFEKTMTRSQGAFS